MATDNPTEIYGRIYLVRNMANGKTYVGQTRKRLVVRWTRHRSCSLTKGGCRLLRRAIEKYGAASFMIMELCQAYSKEELDRLEREQIALHRSDDKRFGYNLMRSGAGSMEHSDETREIMSAMRMGWNPSQATREKMSRSATGRPISAATLEKLRELNTGSANAFYGKKHLPETIARMKESWKKRRLTPVSAETRKKMSIARQGNMNWLGRLRKRSKDNLRLFD
jgi:group I intron endonuclease